MNAPVPEVRVWDLPTRLFHWALVVLIALQYASGEFHLFDMRWHFLLGYATLALIVFRVAWGVCGSQSSRFVDFVRGPRAILAYLRAQAAGAVPARPGHNPLGGWSVLAMLACIGVQALSGLFASDDIDTDGPFAARVSSRTVKLMTRVHHWNENVLLALIALHVGAVLAYLLARRENLIVPMLTGRARASMPAPRIASSWLALLIFAACAACVYAGVAVWGE